METLKIVIHKRAQRTISSVTDWYWGNLGVKAAEKFVRDVDATLNRLSMFPEIGTEYDFPSSSNRKYYSFLIHPRYRVVYSYTASTLYVVAIRATAQCF